MNSPSGLGVYTPEEVWLPFSESLLEWDQGFHELLLGDRIRMVAYKKAIKQSVRPGMTVLDLGTGTGVLALWALEAGAERVYGIDLNGDTLRAAEQRIAAAGFASRFTAIYGISFDVTLGERVDLLVSEIIGNLADNESFVPILRDATERFLKPGGVQIPRRVLSYLVPVEARTAHGQVESGTCRVLSDHYSVEQLLDRCPSRNPFNMYYDAIIPLSCYLAEPLVLRIYSGAWTESPAYDEHRSWRIACDGFFTGFKGYFVADLTEDVVLDISGDDLSGRPSSASWKHAFLPIKTPIEVEAGDQLYLSFLRSLSNGENRWGRQWYGWSGYVLREGQCPGTFLQRTGPR